MNRTKLSSAVAAFAVAALLGLAACSSASGASTASSSSASAASSQASASAQASSASSASASSASALETVGTKSADGTSFTFANKSGKAITSIAVKPTAGGEYSANLLAAGAEIPSGQTVELACPVVPEPAATDSGVQAKRLADISIIVAGGAVYELHQLDVYDIDSSELRLEGELAYLDYETDSGEDVSTLESEKAIAQQLADEAAKAAEQPAPAEESAPAEGVVTYQEDYAYDDGSAYDQGYDSGYAYDNGSAYDTGSGSGGSGGTVDDSAVGSGDEAACVPDIVLRS